MRHTWYETYISSIKLIRRIPRKAESDRTRKLLFTRKELSHLIGLIERKGYALIPLRIYWSNKNLVKVEIGLAKGKKTHDKRQSIKDKDWKRDQARLFKKSR